MAHNAEVREALALLQGLSGSRSGGCGLLTAALHGRMPGKGSCPGAVGREGKGAAGVGKGRAGRREAKGELGVPKGFPRGGAPSGFEEQWNRAPSGERRAGSSTAPGVRWPQNRCVTGSQYGEGEGPKGRPEIGRDWGPSGSEDEGVQRGGGYGNCGQQPPSDSIGAGSAIEGTGAGGQGEASELRGPRDPRVPISQKWPTMLQWSSSEDEGGPGLGEGG
ncbi:hypothetical protein NDU88_010799 [Pleurodeles waltl]|uniref:Uncharacterized protein n=1 Tax=Pleurodeles waltl TaxID=8319 RepID=A0AAV7PZT1_PLEWA|nr:hypothetical protein NDU88_010799 [Pleurodeles waltl]